MNAEILTASEVDEGQLDEFLKQMYPPAKSSFLRSHGGWWHGSDNNRWVLVVDGVIAGYCAVIPTCVWLGGETIPALWWVDLVIAPQYRGQGFQTLFDDRIRAIADLKLGFPNALAAKIHRKHQWGVREDLAVRLCVLNPRQIHTIQTSSGVRGVLIRLFAISTTPYFGYLRRKISGYHPQASRRVEKVSSKQFEEIFERNATNEMQTSFRNVHHFDWRYLSAPYLNELSFYIAGPEQAPTHYLIARHAHSSTKRISRILDLFGDFNDLSTLVDIIKLALKDAVTNQSSLVTMMVTTPELVHAAKRAGFALAAPARFCWHSASSEWMSRLNGRFIWTLGDSDNDEPL